jgi:dolichyl-phosphate-mannose-protein mannosyltransferase
VSAAVARVEARWLWVLIAVAPAITLAPLALLRFLDGDEGSYAEAAALALDGRVPYRDFLYTQTPVLPYAYGAWSEVVGENWYALRAFSLVLGLGVGALLVRHVFVRFGTRAALLASGLFTVSTLVFTWYPTVKTYALSTVLAFGAYVLIAQRDRVTPARWVAAGALASLAVQTRSLVVGAAIAFAWEAIRNRRGLVPYLGGFAVALLPTLVVFALDPSRFLFGNLGVHGVRSSGGLVGDFKQKGEVVANLLGVATDSRPVPQYLLLMGAAVVAAVTLRRTQGRLPLWFLTGALLTLVALAPTPTYTQYVATTIPFLIVGVVELVEELAGSRVPAVLAATGATWLALYALLGPIDVYRLAHSSKENRPAAVQEVTDLIDARTAPGEEVLASWPGYLFGTHAQPVPGLENDFAPHDAEPLAVETAHRNRLVTKADVERMIREHRTRLVVVKLWHDLPPIPDYEGTAQRSGYHLVADVNGAKVYALP